MVFLNKGLLEVVNWLGGRPAGVPSEIILGEDGTTATETDTAVGSAVATTFKVFSSKTVDGFTVSLEHSLSTVEGTGFSFRSISLMTNTAGTASISTASFTRNVYPTITKTALEEMQSTIIIEVINEE